MSGIDEQGGYWARKTANELHLQKICERHVAERISQCVRLSLRMYGESPLRELMNVLPEDDELVEYYRRIKINNIM